MKKDPSVGHAPRNGSFRVTPLMMNVLRRLLDLRTEDRPVVRRVAPLFTCVVAANIVTSAFARALFISHNDYASLPWMFIGASGFTVLASVLYMTLIGRTTPQRRFVGLLTLTAASFALLGLLIPTDPAGWSLVTFAWTTGLGQIVMIQTWSYSTALLPVRQAHRLFPLFSAAATLGAAAGGFLITGLMEVAGLQSLLFTAVVLYLVSGVLANRARDPKSQSGATLRSLKAITTEPPPPVSRKGELRRAFRTLIRNPLLSRITLVVFLVQVASVMVDFQFSAVLKGRYSAGEMAGFLGMYFAGSNLITFVVALGAGRRISRALGVGVASGATAIVLGVGSALVFFAWIGDAVGAAATVIVLTSFAERVVGFGISKHAMNAAITPVDPKTAERARFLIDGVANRLATVAVSIGFLFVGERLADFAAFSPYVLVASVLAIIVSLGLGRVYREALFKTLRARRVEPVARERIQRWGARDARRGIGRMLRQGDSQTVNRGLDLSLELRMPLQVYAVERLLQHPETAVVGHTLEVMNRLGQRAPTELLGPLLTAERPSRILAAALSNLAHGAGEVRPQVVALLQYRDPLVACLALLWLGIPEGQRRSGVLGRIHGRTRRMPRLHLKTQPQAARTPPKRLDFRRHPAVSTGGADASESSPHVSGLVSGALIERLMAFFLQLPHQIHDPNPDVRDTALLAMATLRVPSMVGPLLDALDHPTLREPALRTLERMGPAVVAPVMERRLAADRTQVRERIWLVHAAERLRLSSILASYLDARSRSLRNHAVFCLWRLTGTEPSKGPDRQTLLLHAVGEVHGLMRYAAVDALLSEGGVARSDGPRWDFLRDEIALLRAQAETRAFRLMGMLHARGPLHRAYLHYRSHHGRTRSNAIELLDAMLTSPELRPFIAYIESSTHRDNGSWNGDAELLSNGPVADLITLAQRESDPVDATLPVHDIWLRSIHQWARASGAMPPSRSLTRRIRNARAKKRGGTFGPRVTGATGADIARLLGLGPEPKRPALAPARPEEMLMLSDVMDRVILLRSIPIFEGIPADQLLPLAEITEDAAFPKGVRIMTEGEPGAHVYLVLDGAVEVLRGATRVATLGERECFGMMALLDDSVRSATIVALTDVDCLMIAREDFQDLLDLTPSLARGIIRVLTRRLRNTMDDSFGGASK